MDMEGGETKAKAKAATVTMKEATAKVTDTAKVRVKDGGETNPTPIRVERGNSQINQGNAAKRHDGEKSKEKANPNGKATLFTIATLRDTSAVSRECPKKIADEVKKQSTTNSSQQLTIEDDLDVLFQNILYVHYDDEASDDETMEKEVVYRPTYTMRPDKTWGDEHYKPPWGWDSIPFPAISTRTSNFWRILPTPKTSRK
jgi:hypothetical protein